MYIISVIAALIAGLVISVQGVSNSVGSKLIGMPAMIACLSIIQLIPALILVFWQKPSMGISASIVQGFKWYTISGLIGIIVITALSVAIPHIGALSVFVIVVLGQIIGAAIINQVGLFGSPITPMTPLRLTSILIIAIGVGLLLKSGQTSSLPKSKTMDIVPVHSKSDKEVG